MKAHQHSEEPAKTYCYLNQTNFLPAIPQIRPWNAPMQQHPDVEERVLVEEDWPGVADPPVIPCDGHFPNFHFFASSHRSTLVVLRSLDERYWFVVAVVVRRNWELSPEVAAMTVESLVLPQR